MSENLFGLTVAADKGLDDLQCQRLLSENRRYQEVMLQYAFTITPPSPASGHKNSAPANPSATLGNRRAMY